MLHFNKTEGRSGFTLVEMLLYVTIFSVIFTVLLRLFGQVQYSGTRLQLSNELKENGAQVMQLIGCAVREGYSLPDQGQEKLFVDSANEIVFNVYSKQVSVGDLSVMTHKLSMKQGEDAPVDITSDHIDVTGFVVDHLDGLGPDAVQIELELSSVNLVDDPNFEDHLSTKATFSVRQEI